MTRWVVTGGGGMLGQDLARALEGRDALILGRTSLDVTDAAAVRDVLVGADIVINAAAYTRVDGAESHEDAAWEVNARGAGIVADAARRAGAAMVQISTDYVFDGTAIEPYSEDHPVAPIGAYGRSKAEGERLVAGALAESWIVRTAWLYGAHGPNFARTMAALATNQPTVRVVADQQGQPTWTRDLAAKIVELVDKRVAFGPYHVTNGGDASWFEFAQAIFAELGLEPSRVIPTSSVDFTRPAPRPKYSVLGNAALIKAGVSPLRDWREALASAVLAGVLA